MSPGVAPKVFIVIGPAGSGKSSVSTALSADYDAAYVDKDVVCGRLTEALLEAAGTDPAGRDDNPFYQSTVMDLEYQTLMAIAGSNLRLGRSVVLDAPFGRYLSDPQFLRDNAAAHEWPKADWLVVSVGADGEEIRNRVASRGLSRDRWKLENWDEFWAKASDINCRWSGAQILTVNNRRQPFNRAEAVAQVRRQLE